MLTAYPDEGGVWTIGWGHTLAVVKGMVWTKAEADAHFLADLAEAQVAVTHYVQVNVEQCEYDAMVSFTYEMGGGALRRSTLLALLNSGASAVEVAAQFPRWDEVAGKPDRGVLRRRRAEQAMFLGTLAATDA